MATAEIRDNLRSDVMESRQRSRDKIFNSKRKALQDVVNVGRDVTDSEVVIIGNKLKCKSAVQVKDLVLLQLAFVQNDKNIVVFLKTKGALHALVRELSGGKSNYQLVAAECCCNLALGNAKSCLQVAKAAGPYLITMLSSSNTHLISISVWALGNLVGSDDKTWKVIHAQGFLGKLLQLIKDYDTSSDIPARTEVQQNSLFALTQLLYVGSKLLTPEEVESIVQTIASLSCTSGKGLRVSEFLLSCIDTAEQELIKGKIHNKCLQFLEENDLTEETITLFTPAIRTIANIIAEPSGTCSLEILTNFKLIEDTAQKIYSSPYPHLLQELGWLLGNLMNHPSSEVQEILLQHSFDFQILESQFVFFSK